MSSMNRRDALKRTALVMGTALSASTIAGIMKGCTAQPEIAWTPAYFEQDQAVLVTSLIDVILPATDTPGAKEAGVPKFVEDMVSTIFTEQQQQEFSDGLQAFVAECSSANGKAFASLNAEDQLAYLEGYNTRMQDMMQGGQRSDATPDLRFFHTIKELTVAGFFTSQPGATQVLQYSQIPADYHGCISLEEAGGKTWAT